METEGGVRMSFGEWLRRSFGSSDDIISGQAAAKFYGLDVGDYDRARPHEDDVGLLISPRFAGRSFINIGLDFGYDVNARKPGVPRSQGVYGPKPVAPLDRSDEEFGDIDLSGGKYRLREVFVD